MTKNSVFILAIACALSAPVTAHHSALIFDRDLVVAFQGTVTRFNWTNPHVYIYVETRDDTGELVEWELETDATPILIRSGWAADSLVPGDIVSANDNAVVNRRFGTEESPSQPRRIPRTTR